LPKYGWLISVALISLIGIGYSGYLSYYAFSSGISECELIYFGMPSCFYGLVLYAAIFVPSLAIFLQDKRVKRAALMLGVSLLGVGFSGTLTTYVLTLHGCLASSITLMGLPPCVFGLVMFTLTLILDLSFLRQKQLVQTSSVIEQESGSISATCWLFSKA
jgi:hypothetical protein